MPVPLRRLLGFLKSTVVGGIFVLAPVVLLSIVAGHAVQIAFQVVSPVVAFLPFDTIGSVSLVLVLGIAAVVLVCFAAGLLARTTISQWFVRALEEFVLSFFPSYGLMKSMGQGWVGVEADGLHPSILVRLDDAWQVGFLMDTLPDGRKLVFIPDVPTPWSGSLLVVEAARVETLPLSTRQTVDCLRKLGARSAEVLAKAQA